MLAVGRLKLMWEQRTQNTIVPLAGDRVGRSPARHTILDIIGHLLTDGCQVKKLLFYGWVLGRLGKLPVLNRFVAQIVGPIHVAPRSPLSPEADHSHQ